MQKLTAGITKAGAGIDGIVWNILGQTYVPKSLSESSFSWHATFPPGTFVPPHIHPTQDEFIYLFEGRFDLLLDGKDAVATAGDLIRLPMGQAHGIFNKSDQPVKCFFWVSPTRKLYDLFWAIHSMKEQKPEEVVAISAKYEVNFLPPPG
jgi:quercetin dioxygenase-like cupin family protein